MKKPNKKALFTTVIAFVLSLSFNVVASHGQQQQESKAPASMKSAEAKKHDDAKKHMHHGDHIGHGTEKNQKQQSKESHDHHGDSHEHD